VKAAIEQLIQEPRGPQTIKLEHAPVAEYRRRVGDWRILFDIDDRHQIVEIVDIQLRELRRRLADRKLTLEITDAARTWVANAGYDPHFGARPLKRLIQREIQDPLALMLLSGEIHDGDTVVVDAGEDGLTLRPEEGAAAGSVSPA